MTRLMLAGMLAVLMVGEAPASAHDDYLVVGTITKVTAKTLDVKQNDGETISMHMNASTVVARDKKKVSAAELKTGLSVVVDASGDSLKALLVLEVRIVSTVCSSTPGCTG